jgi:curved DNA-binding protein CbpA
MNYFANCFTIHEAKKRWRDLSLIHHPDKGGDVKVMSEINRQYDAFIPSSQPHSNPYSYNKNAYMDEKNNLFNNPHFFTRAKNEGFQSATGVPWDHPIYVELRELRKKFNYSMEEDLRILKQSNDNLSENLKSERNTISRLQAQLTKYRNMIKELKGITKEPKPKKERLRKKSSKA